MKITVKEINVATGKETIYERNLTEQEVAEREADQAAQAIEQAEAEAKATAKAELLARLGITADEAKLLLG